MVHQPSDSIGHGVTSFRKYSLKNRAMARPSRIMQIGVPIIPNRDAQKWTLAQNHRIGRPRQPTLQGDCQLLRLVCNCRTKSATASQRRMAAAQNCALIQLVDQKTVGSSKKQCTISKEEAPAYRKSSSWPTTAAQRTTATNERNVSSATILIEILVKVSSRKWGRSKQQGGGVVRAFSSDPSVWNLSMRQLLF